MQLLPSLPKAPATWPSLANGTVSGYPKNPNATGLTQLTTGLTADDGQTPAQGPGGRRQLQSGGTRLDATRAQIQSVLDDLYVDHWHANSAVLGVTYSGNVPSVKRLGAHGQVSDARRYATSAGPETGSAAMTLDAASGVWSVTAPTARGTASSTCSTSRSTFHRLDQVVHNLVTDPYAIKLSTDTTARPTRAASSSTWPTPT